MGSSTSKGSSIEKVLATSSSSFPDTERYLGLENFGNTCYCNSVLQALYYCLPFRRGVLKHRSYIPNGPVTRTSKTRDLQEDDGQNLLLCLRELFEAMSTYKRRTGYLAPDRFVSQLKRDNEIFRGNQHQDAHEFLNFILNTADDIITKEHREATTARCNAAGCLCTICQKCCSGVGCPPGPCCCCQQQMERNRRGHRSDNASKNGLCHDDAKHSNGSSSSFERQHCEKCDCDGGAHRWKSFVHELFQSEVSSRTECLNCQAVTTRTEEYLDLSVDVEQNVSLTACLKAFSRCELLRGADKFFCESCNSLQEARKSLHVTRTPQILALHLKRFKYIEQLGRHKKLSDRVAFPFVIRLPETTTSGRQMMMYEVDGSGRGSVDGGSLTAGGVSGQLFHLFAVVIHLGCGPNMGHYVSMIRSASNWLLFDDDDVSAISPTQVQSVFGVGGETSGTTRTSYILFYSADDPSSWFDPPSLTEGSSSGSTKSSLTNQLAPTKTFSTVSSDSGNAMYYTSASSEQR